MPRGCICDSLKKIASSGEHNCLSRNQESSTVRVALFVGSLTLVLERTQTAVARMGDMQDAKCDLSTLNLSPGR